MSARLMDALGPAFAAETQLAVEAVRYGTAARLAIGARIRGGKTSDDLPDPQTQYVIKLVVVFRQDGDRLIYGDLVPGYRIESQALIPHCGTSLHGSHLERAVAFRLRPEDGEPGFSRKMV